MSDSSSSASSESKSNSASSLAPFSSPDSSSSLSPLSPLSPSTQSPSFSLPVESSAAVLDLLALLDASFAGRTLLSGPWTTFLSRETAFTLVSFCAPSSEGFVASSPSSPWLRSTRLPEASSRTAFIERTSSTE
eukprot:CAMPEP_0172590210 /NCGR_PEP_ID=MMETSP1068-20121228/8642_1 /TAXON_ID=35684 /ORGANISM="Pseudopedinella elastica, Strain CCMP716" /LENGTH=133 /DNA_ID=CAMNT_0013385931 /DNA_START=820 /DNA_END=1221 /DNA_ORIENTATION=-